MPALKDLQDHIDKDADWKEAYDANLPKARVAQDKVPLIHVLGVSPASLRSVFLTPPYELVVSNHKVKVCNAPFV